MSPKKPWTVIDSEDVAAHNESREDAPCYAPRGDFLIGLAQEALSFTRRRKLEKEIAVIKSALKGHEEKPMPVAPGNSKPVLTSSRMN